MTPEEVIAQVEKSGLRAGAAAASLRALSGSWHGGPERSEVRHLQCRRGRSRRLHGPVPAGGDSFLVIEGMTIAGYAIGASRGVVYVRAEYPLAIERLEADIKKPGPADCWAKTY